MPRDAAARFLEAKRSNGLADDGRGQGRDIKDLTMKNPGPTSDDTLMKPAQDDLEDAKGPVNGAPSGLLPRRTKPQGKGPNQGLHGNVRTKQEGCSRGVRREKEAETGGSSRIDDANRGGEEREFQDRTRWDEVGTGRSTPARSSMGCKDQQRIAGGRRAGGGGFAISTDVPTGDWRPPQTARENLDGQDDGGQTSRPLRLSLSLSLTSSRTHDYCTAREKGYHHHHQHGPELMTRRARPCLAAARYLRFHRAKGSVVSVRPSHDMRGHGVSARCSLLLCPPLCADEARARPPPPRGRMRLRSDTTRQAGRASKQAARKKRLDHRGAHWPRAQAPTPQRTWGAQTGRRKRQGGLAIKVLGSRQALSIQKPPADKPTTNAARIQLLSQPAQKPRAALAGPSFCELAPSSARAVQSLAAPRSYGQG
ncbi:hypothetical protein PCL_01900 [Purpureocillium lilacinum]|uniref:Uncharacterized protein n=1 Tax=Purpureocillium lilacinum TaxID=33203 RepID=A0A2U3E2S1_PURLI|nr:hypothetical protein PCL_01900 [Purpureocillium lilacinum]